MSDGTLSLTKHYVLSKLVRQIASVRPGMTEAEVRKTLASPHVELADDLFEYDEKGEVIDSMLLETCRSGAPGAVRLVWVALVSADDRLQALLADFLTDTSGHIRSDRYSRTEIQGFLETLESGDRDMQKAASNVAHYFEQARILFQRSTGPRLSASPASSTRRLPCLWPSRFLLRSTDGTIRSWSTSGHHD